MLGLIQNGGGGLRKPLPQPRRKRLAVFLTLAGGAALAALVTQTSSTQVELKVRSLPPGIVTSNAFYAVETVVTVPAPPLAANGYRFVYWMIDGVRQENAFGISRTGLSFKILENTDVVAHYALQAEDTDADGLPDWYELYNYGSLTQSADSDTDEDGVIFIDEYRKGSEPRIADSAADGGIVQGGISRRRGGMLAAIIGNDWHRYAEKSLPGGAVDRTDYLRSGTEVTTANLQGDYLGYRFTQWKINGERMTNSSGVALNQVKFSISSDTAALAELVPARLDEDADAVPDWFEIYHYGDTGQGADSDTDADGRNLLDEFRAGTQPRIVDTAEGGWVVEGGIARKRGAKLALAFADTYVRYIETSQPPGVVWRDEYLTIGSTVSTASAPSEVRGYKFGQWILDGVRQESPVGIALTQVNFTLQASSTAVAHYYPANDDLDADEILDWYEYQQYGTVDFGPDSDTDNDGKSLLEEYRGGTQPRIFDSAQDGGIVEGGVSRRRGEELVVNLQFFPAERKLPVNGQTEEFFGDPYNGIPGVNVSAAGRATPSLGDLDGDGDLDLIVAGADGALRVFENVGSPIKPAFAERGEWAAFLDGLPDGPLYPALGDWNRDLRADLAFGSPEGTVRFFLSNGFSSSPTPAGTLTAGTGSVMPAFVPGNGSLDLLVLKQEGTVDRYAYSGEALLPYAAPAAASNILPDLVVNGRSLAVANGNNDALPDILASDADGRIWLFRAVNGGGYVLNSKVWGGAYRGFADDLRITVADLNGDGTPDIVGGIADGSLVFLRNPQKKLRIGPPVGTVLTGESVPFRSIDDDGTLRWEFVYNGSGGTIDALTGFYTAGPKAGQDGILARSAAGSTGTAWINVVSAGETDDLGKALIVAGRRSVNDPVWPSARWLANRAHDVLRYRGFQPADLGYLSHEASDPGVTGAPTVAALQQAIQNAQGEDRLLLYLVDHGRVAPGGTDGLFLLGPGEQFTGSQLDTWIDDYQAANPEAEVIIILECCYAQRLAEKLNDGDPPKRAVYAAAARNEVAHMVAGGSVSYSAMLWSELSLGATFEEAHQTALKAMQDFQTGRAYDPHGIGLSRGLGLGSVLQLDRPSVKDVSAPQSLSGTATATLWASGISGSFQIEEVWAVVVPPDYQADGDAPVVDLPELQLVWNSTNQRYEIEYGGFTEGGADNPYIVFIYARDIWGQVSLPIVTTVTQEGYLNRVLLVAHGHASDNENSRRVWDVADFAHEATLMRRLDPENIRYLSDQVGANPRVTHGSTASDLRDALLSWPLPSGKSLNAVTIYLVGDASRQGLLFSNGDLVAPAQLKSWLDELQGATGCTVNLIVDSDFSGRFVSGCASNVYERTVISGSGPDQGAPGSSMWAGLSRWFWQAVAKGNDVRSSFAYASDVMRWVGHVPFMLDDDGDGIFNRSRDGLNALSSFVGAAFVTASDPPHIGLASKPINAGLNDTVNFWVADVVMPDGNPPLAVWADLIDPIGKSLGTVELLWNKVYHRYDGFIEGFAVPGRHVAMVYAGDPSNPRSVSSAAPVQIFVDAVPPTVTALEATGLQLPLTGQVFEATIAPGGAPFEALLTAAPGQKISLEVFGVSAGRNVSLSIHGPDGSELARRDEWGNGFGEKIWAWEPTFAATYKVRVSAAVSTGKTDFSVRGFLQQGTIEYGDRTAQSIFFNLPGEWSLLKGELPLDVSATSGLTPDVEVVDGNATIVEGKLVASEAGPVTLRARQDGSDLYFPAPPVVRTVTVDAAPDTEAPVIELIGENPMEVLQGTSFTDPGAKVTDNIDQGRTISCEGSVDTLTLGTYTLTYNAIDAAGNAADEVTRTVNVVAAPDLGPLDSDGDGVNDYREAKDGTNPNDPHSFNQLSRGLVACYPFDGNANDESGYGNNGSATNLAFTNNLAGKPASAAHFNGSAGISVPESKSLQLPSRFSISTWVNISTWEGYGGNNGHPIVSAGGQPNVSEQAFGTGLTEWSSDFMFAGANDYPTSSVIHFSRSYSPMADLSNVANQIPLAKLGVTPGQWRLLTWTYDGNTVRSYLDAHLLQSFQSANSAEIIPYLGWAIMRIGFNNNHEYLRGALDGFRIYSRALSANEVAQLYVYESGQETDVDGDGLTDAWERGFGRYQIVGGNFTWDQAKVDAESRGGHLATITSEAEWMRVWAEASYYPHLAGVWLGGSDMRENGVWEWVTGESWSYARWGGGEPNDFFGPSSENFLVQNLPAHDASGAWNDIPNSRWPQSYVLEFGYPTDPLKADTDGDGYNDKVETDAGSDPNNAGSVPDSVDTEAPIIELIGENPMEVLQKSEFTDPGAIVTDNLDEERTIDGEGLVDTSTLGTYTLTYNAMDAAGNAADEVIRTVNVVAAPDLGPLDSDADGVNDYRESYDGTDPSAPESFDPLSQGLVAHFDGESLNDRAGVHDLVLSTKGGASFGEGKKSQALLLDGVDDGFLLPDVDALKLQSFSIGAWVRWSGVTDTPQMVIFRGGYDSGNDPFTMAIGNDGEIATQINLGVSPTSTLAAEPNSSIVDRWVHMLATFDVASKSHRLYLNGSLVAQGSCDGPMVSELPSWAQPGWGLGNHSGNVYNYAFGGAIDEARFYNRALTEQEVALLYQRDSGSNDTDGDGLTDDWERGVGRYHIMEGNFTWDQAKADAEARGGRLATITSQSEWDMIKDVLSASIAGKNMWLGGTDQDQEGQWKWITGEAWSFTRWLPGEPNNTINGLAENYLHTFGYEDEDQRWNDLHGAPQDLPLNPGTEFVDGSRGNLHYLLEFGYPTDPFNADTDGDGYDDKVESDAGSDPNNPESYPGSMSQFVLIDFDSIPGMRNVPGSPVPETSRLTDQFLSAYGVRFRSAAGYAAVCIHEDPGWAEAGNPIGGFPAPTLSAPNVLGGTTADGKMAYSGPITITFHDPANPERPAVTDYVRIRGEMAPLDGASAKMEAFGLDGKLLGSVSDFDSSAGLTLSISLPGIHSIRLTQQNSGEPFGTIGFDNLEFHPVSSATAMTSVAGGRLPASSGMSGTEVSDFRIGTYEVTWGEWRNISSRALALGYDLGGVGKGSADNHPVREVSWYDAVKWCNAKSELEGLTPAYRLPDGSVYRSGQYEPQWDSSADGYRLPTEAESEWAAWGGVLSEGFLYPGSNNLDEVAWYIGNASGSINDYHGGRGSWPVGLKLPNELGLYDMGGNVAEWCWDLRSPGYRVYYGSSNYTIPEHCLTQFRNMSPFIATVRNPHIGLRLARNAFSSPNLVVNGSFELPALANGAIWPNAPVEGWTSSDGTYERWTGGYSGFAARDGVSHVELQVNGPTTIWQNIPTSPGLVYKLRFSAAHRGLTGFSQIDVYVDGAFVFSTGPISEPYKWFDYSSEFVASSLASKLEFRSAGNHATAVGDHLDNVVVTVPYAPEGIDTEAPIIELIGENPMEVLQGSEFTDPGAIVTDNVDEERTISGEGSVDALALGTYTLTYNAIDAAGNAADEVTRTVNVVAAPDLGPLDSDGDGANDYREVQDGTDPHDPNSLNSLSQGLIAYLPFENSFADESGFSNDLVNRSAGIVLTEGRFGQPNGAVLISGAYDTASSAKNLEISGNQNHTVSFWFKSSNPTYEQMVLGFGSYLGGEGNTRWCLLTGSPDSDAYASWYGNWADGNRVFTGRGNLFYNQWHHVVYIHEGSVTGTKVFLDGELVETGGAAVQSDRLNIQSTPLLLGNWIFWATSTPGKHVSDVRIYNRALSASEVGQLYQTEGANPDSDGDGLTDRWEQGYGRYQIVEGIFTWREALADARTRGGHLASITSQSESDFVGAVLDGSYPVLWLGAGGWKGGRWRWITGERWSYTNWHDGEPGDSGPYFSNFDYLQINYNAPDLSWSKYHPEQDPQPSGYLLEFGYPTDPFKADTDDDGFDDKVESDAGSDPNNSYSVPGYADRDGDGVNEYREAVDETDPLDPDSYDVLSQGLLAYYPLNGDAGDYSGFGRELAIRGSTEFVNSRSSDGLALSFREDVPGLQALGSGADLQGSSLSVAFWYRKEAEPVGDWIFCIGSEGGSGGSVHFALDYPQDIRFSFFHNDLDYTASPSHAPDRWYHVVGTYDQASGLRKLFIDGVQVAEDTAPEGFRGNDVFAFGKSGTTMDEVRIYNRALSPAEAGLLYHVELGDLDSDEDGLSDAWERGFGRYMVVEGAFTWEEAKEDAEQYGGHLATITSAAESALVQSLVDAAEVKDNYWLGGTDKEEEGVWRWITGEAWSFTNWELVGGEPNNVTGYDNYLNLWGNPGASFQYKYGYWNDYIESDAIRMSYILEFGYPTDPYNADTDGDGYNDWEESDAGSDPNNAGSVPGWADTEAPIIELIGENPMEVLQGSEFTDPGAIVTDNFDEERTVSGEGSVDTSTLGTYTLTYNASDAAGNVANEVTRTVVVTSGANGRRFYVDATAAPGGDGLSWSSAFRFLQDALDETVSGRGDEVWIADGTYLPDHGANVSKGDRTASFMLKNGVALFGGFGGGETELDQRDVQEHLSQLSGKIGPEEDSWSFHVCTVEQAASVVLDGLTITGGRANGIGEGEDRAAAVYSASADYWVTASGCIFTDNAADEVGGVAFGGYWYVSDSTFVGNYAYHGGVAREGEWSVTNCNFNGNSAFHGGVGRDGLWEVFDSTFNGNSANYGGVAFDGSWEASDSNFKANSAVVEAGVNYRGTWRVNNCSFISNTASSGGVGSQGEWTISRSLFVDNSAGSGGVIYGGTWLLNSCDFSSNRSGGGGGVSTFGHVTAINSTFTVNSGNAGVSHKSVWTAYHCTFQGNSGVGVADSWTIINSVFADGSSWFTSHVSNTTPSGERARNVIRGADTAFPATGTDLGYGFVIDANPRFVDPADPAGPDGKFGTADDGLRLKVGSAAIGQGDSAFLPEDSFDLDEDGITNEPLPIDRVGRSRVEQGRLDLGAYQFGTAIAPVVQIIGANPLELPRGAAFTDPGALVTDDLDDDKTIYGSGSVDTGTVGSYVLTYKASDSDGNMSQAATRTVIIKDAEAPVIALLGANPLEVGRGATFTDPGAKVTDDVDAEKTISGTGTVNTAVVGSYTLTYNASDAAGNAAAPVTRTVIVKDLTLPTITLLGANPMELALGAAFADPGAKVTDDVDAERTINGVGAVNTATAGTYTLTYSASDAAGNEADPVTRTVVVNKATPAVTWMNPAAIVYGTALSSVQLNASSSLAGAFAYSPAAGTLLDVGTNVLTAVFTPTDTNNYRNRTNTVNLVVNKATPAVTWSNPAAIVYGTALSAEQLNASSSVAGAFAYSPAAGTVLNVGTNVLTAVFTPADTNNYRNRTNTVNLVVNKMTPAVTWSNPAAIVYGTALSAAQLNATSSVAGAFAYSPAAGTVLNVGTNILSAVFTPADTNNYRNATNTVSMVVEDASAPVITLLGANPLEVNRGASFTDPGAKVTDDVDAEKTISGTGTVNTAVVGSYTLTYNASDAAGNAAVAVTRTVVVKDVSAPVITLLGANPLEVNRGATFSDPGAKVTDDVDAEKTISGTGTVNTAVVGSYTLTYNASDAAGNAAAAVTRTVVVKDVSAPVITLLGANPLEVNRGATFTDPGAKVTDDVDAEKTISGTGTVNTAVVGSYTVTYNASDAAGNAASPVTRTVVVKDVAAPVITLMGANPLEVSRGATFTDPGAKVSDDVDAEKTISGTGTVNTAVVGSYTLTYNASDAAGNAAVAVTRTVVVKDVAAPVITLLGANPLEVNRGATFTDPGAKVTDDVDAEKTISGTGTVNTAVVGSYTLTYNASDAAGNAAVAVTRTVVVKDVAAPVITLLGANPLEVNRGATFTDPGAKVTDDVDAEKTISGTGTVNTAVVGSYTLTYNANDAAGNAAVALTRTVVVKDVAAPVITLSGANPLEVNRGATFTDPGAKVTDDVDAEKTISGTGTVNTAVVGSYTLTYNANDAAGNAAAPVTRTVVVKDVGIPVITLLGDNPLEVIQGNALQDPGAIVTDDVDPERSILGSGAVNTSVVGTYTLTYSATDAAGNAAAVVTRTVIVLSSAPDFGSASGAYLGNFFLDQGLPEDFIRSGGQVALQITSRGRFTGSCIINGTKVGIRGGFDEDGNALVSLPARVAGANAFLQLLLGRDSLGYRITGVVSLDGEEIDLVSLPVAFDGGDKKFLGGERLNSLLTSNDVSGFTFGHGFLAAKLRPNGALSFSGRLADGTVVTGVSRMVVDEQSQWRVPVAIPLTRVKGLLIGESVVSVEEGLQTDTDESWKWVRPANLRARSYADGFIEDLTVNGRWWNWTAGNSPLGGDAAVVSFLLMTDPYSGEGSDLVGSWGTSSRPTWVGEVPRGLRFTIKTSTGVFSARVPIGPDATQVLAHGLLVSPNGLDLGNDVPTLGGGFGVSGELSVPIEIRAMTP